MATVKKYKVCRRLGPEVYDKCQTQKFALSEARHARTKKRRRRPLSNYGVQLIEKQKVRFMYGVSERQFANYVHDAMEHHGNGAERLLQNLELRLDNVVYRLGLAHTRPLARQMVSHGHFVVNGKRTNVPSFRVRKGDVVSIREGSKAKKLFENLEKRLKDHTAPAWLSFDIKKATGTVTSLPAATDDVFDLTSIIEFYSR